jgi:hypothetical protein
MMKQSIAEEVAGLRSDKELLAAPEDQRQKLVDQLELTSRESAERDQKENSTHCT